MKHAQTRKFDPSFGTATQAINAVDRAPLWDRDDVNSVGYDDSFADGFSALEHIYDVHQESS